MLASWANCDKNTYIGLWQRGKPDVLAVFDDRPARALQVDIDVLRAMHAELATCCHDHAGLDTGDVGWPGDLAADDQ